MPNLNVPVSVRAIAFIDTKVQNYQSLVAGVTPGTEVVVLDGNEDAIAQITQILALRTNIDSIHIVSHGAPGSLQLGKTGLSVDNLETYSQQLQGWRSAFTDSADILIYGCNVASGPRVCPTVRRGFKSPSHSESRLKPTGNNLNKQSSTEDFRYETGNSFPGGTGEQARDLDVDLERDGFTFIQRIAQLTNTNVAASKNLTGSAEKGGDWKLEARIGEINTPLVFEPEVLANYEHVLNTFGAAKNFPVTSSLRKVATGDFNKDGNLDLAFATTREDRNVSIALGDGTGNFGTATSLNTNPATYPATFFVAVGDFNGDGNADLATANNGSNNVSVLLGIGNGTFGTATNFSVGSSPYTVAVGDFNKDGKQDLVTANQSGNNVSVLLGAGSGTFGTATNFSVGSSPYTVAVGDFNKDGISDLATANFGSNNISILLGTSNGSFGTATNFTVGNSPNYIAVGDFNGDGKSDLATSNEGSNNVSVLLGNGTGSFGAATNFGVATQPLSIAAGDFNVDGKLDLATANNGSSDVSVLFGTGSGTFGTATNFVVGTNPQGIAVGDFNKDGLSDLATANFKSANVSILLNTTPAVNFGAATYAGTEATADTVVNIPVTINGTPNAAVTVPIVINPSSTATQNSDYTFSPTTVTFPAGTTTLTQNVAVTIKPDSIFENAETAIFKFGTITGGVEGTTKQTTLTIAANGQPSNLTPYQIDLKTGAITGQPNQFISLVNSPADSNGDSWLETVAKINFQGNVKKAKFIVEYDKAPSGWTVNLGDSKSNDGYGGDSGDQSRDAEVQIVNGSMAVFGNDYNTPSGGQLTQGNVPNFVSNGSRVELEVSNENLAWDNKTGLKNSLNSPYLYALNGQADDGGLVNSEIYAGFNRVISGPGDRVGSGASKVTILLNPIDYAISAGAAKVAEGNTGKTAATFTVTRSGCTELASSINYAIAGTATNGTDYNNIGGTSGATGATGTINFAAGETSKTITLDVLGDTAVEPDEDINVTLSNPTASSSTPTIVTAVAKTAIANDDTAGFTVAPTNITATEGGATGSYKVKLNSQPTAPVNISFNTGNAISPIAQITFDSTNWNVEKTITATAIDDTVAQGTHTGTIAHTATSTDVSYNAKVIPNVTASITDNDSPGVSIVQSAGSTNIAEGGATATYGVVLTTIPTAPVTINFDAGTQISAIAPITFTPTTWNSVQNVTVGAIDDSIAQGTHSGTITHKSVSTDTKYNNLTISPVTATIADNDTASVTISPTSTTATEAGATGKYSVQLKSQPTAPVTISFGTGDQISAIGSVTFDSSNWNVPKAVTVTATDDTVVEGNHTGSISHTAASADAKYNGIVIPGVAVAIADNDVAPPKPVVDPVIPKPVVDPVIPKPVVDPVIPKPVVDPVIPKPVVDPVIPKPVVDPVIPKPVVDPVIPKPVVDPVIPKPVDPVIPKPVVDPVIPKPVDPVIPKPVVDPPTRMGGNDTIAGGIDAKNWCGIEAGLDKLEKILDDQLQAVNLPIVGPIKNISPDFISNIKTKLVDTIKNGANQSLSQLESSIRNTLGPDFDVKIDGNSTSDESTLLITLGKKYQFPDINLSKDLGVPVLGLNIDGKAKSKYEYNLSLGVGVSKEFGCYIDTDKTKLTANIDLALNDEFKAKGNLGFFQADLANDVNNPTKVDANLKVKLNDLDNLGLPNDGDRLTLPELQGNYQFKDLFNANLTSNANLGLTGKTSINGNAAFPSYHFDLAVNWPILNYANGQLTGPQKPTVAFNNMQLDLGTFVNNFAKPIIGKISDVIKPFRPVINFLNADTKLLSKLGIAGPFDKNGDGKVSVLELAAKISGRDIDTRFLDAVAKVDKVVNLANQIANSPDKIDLGSYTLGNIDVSDGTANLQNAYSVPKTNTQQTANQQIDSKTSGKVKEFLNALKDIDGFDVPLLTKPETAIQLLIGKPDVPVFTYQMPKLGFDFNIRKDFPIWGPIKGLLEGKFSASAHLGFGYDTYGLSEWKNSNFAAGSAGKVLDGFYVSDRLNADGTGADVDELTLDASIAVGAGLDVAVAKAYVKGGIEGKVGIDLIDIGEFQPKQGGDGKIRTSEITSRISKPTELFDITGKVNAFLGAEVKTISVKFCEKTFKIFRKRISIPYPCGVDYKTVYDNNFATFELASFSLGPSSSTRGKAINGYMAGATVFFDANFNGVKDDSEPFSITNADGSFDLDVSLDKFDKNNSGNLEPDEGRIVLTDGINTSTDLPQEAPLFATPDATVVTPLTTLMTELVEQGIGVNEAQNRVKSGLGLSSGIDLTSYDALEAITQNDPNGLAVYAAHAQVQNTIVLVTDLISGASTTAKNEIADRIISTIANQIKSGAVDLTNPAQLQTVIQSAATQLQAETASNLAPEVAKIIAEGNQRIGAIASSNSSPSDAATEIARVQKVEQGEVAKDLQQVAAGSKTIQQAIAENTGASLNTQIQSATANNPTVRNTVTDDSSAPSNPEEPLPDSGIELVKDGQNFTESTDGDDTLVGGAADDLLRGKKGNDFLFGLDGNDWINGNQGNDLTDGGIGDDTLYGGKGFDTLTGGAGNDFISGNRGEDILMGEKGEDTLYGGQGNDILVGGEGNDYLSGDLGDDTLLGGLGGDRFLLSTNSGIDTIADFEDGKDLLILGNGVTFSQLAITESNGITQISFASTGQVFASLIGVSATAINAANFSLL